LKAFLHIRRTYSISDRGQILAVGHDSRVGPCARFNCPESLYLLTPR
jgi:hypothetical protein